MRNADVREILKLKMVVKWNKLYANPVLPYSKKMSEEMDLSTDVLKLKVQMNKILMGRADQERREVRQLEMIEEEW